MPYILSTKDNNYHTIIECIPSKLMQLKFVNTIFLFWWSISKSSSVKLHCGNVVNKLYSHRQKELQFRFLQVGSLLTMVRHCITLEGIRVTTQEELSLWFSDHELWLNLRGRKVVTTDCQQWVLSCPSREALFIIRQHVISLQAWPGRLQQLNTLYIFNHRRGSKAVHLYFQDWGTLGLGCKKKSVKNWRGLDRCLPERGRLECNFMFTLYRQTSKAHFSGLFTNVWTSSERMTSQWCISDPQCKLLYLCIPLINLITAFFHPGLGYYTTETGLWAMNNSRTEQHDPMRPISISTYRKTLACS